MKKMMIAATLASCTVMVGAAQAIVLKVDPRSAHVDDRVTVSVTGLSPWLALAYQISTDNGRTWHSLDSSGRITNNSASVYVCRQEPCKLVFPSPDVASGVEFRVALVDPRTRQWVFGSKTNQLATWTEPPGASEDFRATFSWNSPGGSTVLNMNPGTHTGSKRSWHLFGTATNGAHIDCRGGGTGTISCRATWGSTVWQCTGSGGFGGNQWFMSRNCRGTMTANGRAGPVETFGEVYIKASRLS